MSYGLGDGLALAGSYWLLLGLLQSASRESFQEHQRVVPNQGISRSLHNGLLLGLLSGVVWVIIGAIAILTSDVLGYVIRDVVRHGLNYGLGEVINYGLCNV